MMEIVAYLALAFTGISLGLIGGGGSILTVPVLVYLFGIDPVLATSYSLFVVGCTSLVGAAGSYRKGLVHLPTVVLFGLSSIATVFITRKFIIPLIPVVVGHINGFAITQQMLTMVLFAILMVAAAWAMIKNGVHQSDAQTLQGSSSAHIKLLVFGVIIGFITGILGAGGGFLLIPTLVLLVGLPMKKAVGTSLLIIALNSLIGFTGDVGHFTMNWHFLIVVTAIAIAGIFAGGSIAKYIDGSKLKKGFGWFVLLMGSYIIVKELFFN